MNKKLLKIKIAEPNKTENKLSNQAQECGQKRPKMWPKVVMNLPVIGGAGSSLRGLLRSEREQARLSPLSSLAVGSVLRDLVLLSAKKSKTKEKNKIHAKKFETLRLVYTSD